MATLKRLLYINMPVLGPIYGLICYPLLDHMDYQLLLLILVYSYVARIFYLLQDHFLPTMADNQFEIYQESIRRALQTQHENPVAYSKLRYALLVFCCSEFTKLITHLVYVIE